MSCLRALLLNDSELQDKRCMLVSSPGSAVASIRHPTWVEEGAEDATRYGLHYSEKSWAGGMMDDTTECGT